MLIIKSQNFIEQKLPNKLHPKNTQEHLDEMVMDMFPLNHRSWVRSQPWACSSVKFFLGRTFPPIMVIPGLRD